MKTKRPRLLKFYYAYGVDRAREVVIVRCKTLADAKEERDRMKQSNSVLVGHSASKMTETAICESCISRGWKIELVRWYKP